MSSTAPTNETTVPPILEFKQVSFEGSGETSIRMHAFTGVIGPGDLVEVELERHHDPRDLVSMMVGLNEPESGEIYFKRHDWRGSDYARHFEMRSEIGRVFAGSAWVQSLTLKDNIQLAMRHHGVDHTQAEEKTEHWIQRVSGSQLAKVKWALKKRPSVVEPSVLQLCQFIRAVANNPRLLILERPLRYMLESLYDNFVSAVDELRSAGTAVLFFAGDRDQYQLQFRQPVIHWKIVDGLMNTNGRPRR